MTQSKSGPDDVYGFYGRLTRDFPSQLIVDTTEICNLACTHCPHPDFSKSEHYGGRSLDHELNVKLVGEVAEHGRGLTKFIRYTSNGEPMAHKHCFEMLEYAARNSGTTVALTTNGKILNAARAERLVSTGVDVVDISIDAFRDETYAQIRVKGNLKVTRANVQRLIALSKENGIKSKSKMRRSLTNICQISTFCTPMAGRSKISRDWNIVGIWPKCD